MVERKSPAGPDLSRAEFLKLSLGAASMAAIGPHRVFAAEGGMLRRAIPATGETVPAVGLGTALSFGRPGDQAGFDLRKQAIRALLEGGGTVIDTAPVYADAEEVVGRALDELGMREQAFLATKISISGQSRGVAQHRQSTQDLRTDVFDLLQVHNLRDTDAHMETLVRLKEEGRIRYIGVTSSRPSRNRQMVEAIGAHPLDFVQCQYNILERGIENTILPAAMEKGVAVMINVPFARGRLFRAAQGTEVPEWAGEFGADTWGKFFLKFILAHEAVTVVIPGSTRARHVVDNLGALRGRLPDAKERGRMVELVENI